MFARSLALRILVLNLLLVIVPLLTYLLAIGGWEYEKEIVTYIHRLQNGTLLRAAYLNQIIEDQYTTLDFIVGMYAINRPEALKNIDPVMQHLNLPSIYSISTFLARTPDNRYIEEYSTLKDEIGRDLTYREYIQLAAATGYSVYLAYDDLSLTPEFLQYFLYDFSQRKILAK